jgi:hypothetical protein
MPLGPALADVWPQARVAWPSAALEAAAKGEDQQGIAACMMKSPLG